MQATMMVDQNAVNVDLADIMEVVTLYKCKFCDFSCGQPAGIGQHVQQAHALIKHPKTNATAQVLHMVPSSTDHAMETHNPMSDVTFETGTQANPSEDADTSMGDVIMYSTLGRKLAELGAGDKIIDAASVQQEESVMNEDAGADGIPINKEIYLCGQCNLGFDTMENCKNHMIRDHNIVIEEDEEPERKSARLEVSHDESDVGTEVHIPGEVTFPPNRVSVGTQVMTRKKPGRKRKVKIETKPQISIEEEFEEEMAAAELAERENRSDAQYEDDESHGMSEKERSEDYAEDGTGVGRRKRRLPTRLASLYYMGKRSPVRTPTIRYPPPARIKTEPYNLRCPKSGCHTKFRTEPSLDLHLACHKRTETKTGQREIFACPKCDTTEAQWKVLRVHLWKEHAVDTDLYACDKCDFKVDTLFRLERHAQIHSEDRPYVCPTCDKGFKQASQLHNHKAVHMDRSADSTKWYSSKLCDICKRTFANQKSLKIHIETVHSKERRFVCPYCNHATSRKAILDLHVRTHTGEKPFKCDMCAYMTGDHNSLRRHKMRHTGEKPYRCRYCPYSAIQAISLKTHMKNKHPGFEGIFACSLCQYQTVNESYYNQHLMDHKNGLVQSIRTTLVTRAGAGMDDDNPRVTTPSRLPPPLTKGVVAPGQTLLRPSLAGGVHQRLITLPDGRQAVAIQAPNLSHSAAANVQQPTSLTKLNDLGMLEVGSDMAQLIYTALSALSQTGAVPEEALVSTQQSGGMIAQPTVQSTTHEGVTTHTITFHIPPAEDGEQTEDSSKPFQPSPHSDEETTHEGAKEIHVQQQDDGQVLLTVEPVENQQQSAIDDAIGDAVEVTFATEEVAPSVLHVADGQGGVRVLEIISNEAPEPSYASPLEQGESMEITPATKVMGIEQGDVNTIVMEVVDEQGNIQQTQYLTCTIDPEN